MRDQLSLFEETIPTDNNRTKYLNNLRHLAEVRKVLASTPSYEEKIKTSRRLISIGTTADRVAS